MAPRSGALRITALGASALVVGALIASSTPARACDCMRLPALSARVAGEADVLFAGRAIEVAERNEHLTRTHWGDSEGSTRFLEKWVTFVVSQSWRGVTADTVEVAVDNSDCEFAFEPGTDYLVFAHRAVNARPWTNACTRTSTLAAAGSVLPLLGRGRTHPKLRRTR